MINRRKVIQSLAALPFAGSLLGTNSLAAQSKTAARANVIYPHVFH